MENILCEVFHPEVTHQFLVISIKKNTHTRKPIALETMQNSNIESIIQTEMMLHHDVSSIFCII